MRSFVRGTWILVALACACGDVKKRGGEDDGDDAGDDGGDDGGDGSSGAFTIAADERVMVRQGDAADITVTVTREDGFAEAIEIELGDAPAGVSGGPLTIAAGETTGTLTLTAASDSPQGASATELVGSAADMSEAAALRLLIAGPAGTADLSFGEAGRFSTQVGEIPTFGRGLCIQEDGKIVLTGATQSQTIVVRLDEAGAPDPGFGEEGTVTTGVGVSSGGIVVTALPGGRVVVAGWAGDIVADNDLALFGYTAGGALDEDFGAGGTARTAVGTGYGEVHQILVDGAGNLIAAGALFGDPPSSHVRRYTAGGEEDATFGGDLADALAETATLLQDGRLLVAGTSASDFWLVRYSAEGVLDGDFATTGAALVDFEGASDTASAVLPAEAGKILLIGITQPTGVESRVLSLARLNPNGSPDLTYGTAGKIQTPISFDTRASTAAAYDGEGRIIVAGRIPGEPNAHLAALRILSDGTLDDTFGEAGVALIDFEIPVSGTNGTFGMTLDGDGRILLSGEIGSGPTASIAAARIWP